MSIKKSEQERLECVTSRLEVLKQCYEEGDLTDLNHVLFLSNQVDELVMMLSDIGIGIRQSYRQQQSKFQEEELTAISPEDQVWMLELLGGI